MDTTPVEMRSESLLLPCAPSSSGVRMPCCTSTARSSAHGEDGADDAVSLDERLGRVVRTHGFLALSVSPRHLSRVERYLAAAPALAPFSLEAGLIRHMKSVAAELGADWNVVVAADAEPAGSKHRRNLDQLVRRAVPGLAHEAATAPEPLLLTHPGLPARYRQLDVLANVQEACQRGMAPAARLLCIAADDSVNMPVIDGHALPVVFAAAWMRPGRAWLSRTGSAVAAPAGVDGAGANHAAGRPAPQPYRFCAIIWTRNEERGTRNEERASRYPKEWT